MATKKRKVTTAIVAGVAAVALLLGGTFAWQSISQTALNEASDVINPGGRLHDDFDGSNKDVYVENFADEPIFARIQLSEYFAIIANYGKGEAETRNELVGTLSADGTYTYETHLFDTADGAHDYWNWATGGSTVYMPTFNKNKDSLEADINGTYVDAVGGISNRDGNQYTDYTEYEVDATDTADAIYDADANNIEDDGVTYVNETHTAKETLGATLISMDEWMNDYGSQPGEYWVYDTDGWVYWAQAIAPDTATGLLLDSIELSQVMDDTWYYAINVEAQFVTADDVGKSDSTGFYEDAAKAPSANAEALLKAIGVQIDGESTDDSGNEGNEGNEGEVTTPTITYGSMEMPYAIPSGTAINLGVADYEGDASAIKYYIINHANNSELVADTNQYYTTPLEAKDGVTVLALEGSFMGQPITQYFYGEEINSSEIASFSATDTSQLETVTFVAATQSDAGEIEIIAEVTTKIYNSATHTYYGNASNEDNSWYLAFEALDESGNETGNYCAASGTMISTNLYELYPIETATWNEEYQWYDITGISETACDGTHGASAGTATQLTISIVETDYDGALTKGDTESITLKVDGDYSADDIVWSEESTGVAFSYNLTENDDGTITISHRSSGVCGGNGQTFIATLKSNPSATGSISIVCDC